MPAYIFICHLLIFIQFSYSRITYNPNQNVISGDLVADHEKVNKLWTGKIPEQAIVNAKKNLKIGYGHASHGDQIRLGMNALVAFANDGHLGYAYSKNLFAFSQSGGADSLYFFNGSFDRDNPGDLLSGDAGWANAHFAEETREFLNDPQHTDCNVIMWAWCGQLAAASDTGLQKLYLDQLNQLEKEYPSVAFIYSTGHLDDDGNAEHVANIQARNNQIRHYCNTNRKWLYDFADIESYDPDGVCYLDKLASDGCNYDKNGDGVLTLDNSDPRVATGGDGNWALEWESKHTKGIEWYHCGADMAHTREINGNMKAYAAWWLWARLGGWNESTTSVLNKPLLQAQPVQVIQTPAKKLISVAINGTTEKIDRVTLVNSSGKIMPIHTETISNNFMSINMKNLSSGVYFMIINSGDRMFNNRVVLF